MVTGETNTGKTRSLKELCQRKGVFYANVDGNNKLPFKNNAFVYNMTDPKHIFSIFEQFEANDEYHTFILDTVTFWFNHYVDTYQKQYKNGLAFWNDFGMDVRKLFVDVFKKSNKNVIVLAHVNKVYNEHSQEYEFKIPIKGSTKDIGIEAFVQNIVTTKTMNISKLEKYVNPNLTFTPKEKELGVKYVYQLGKTKEFPNEKVRMPEDLFEGDPTYIDNNMALLIDALDNY